MGILEQPCSFLSQRPHTCCSFCVECFSFLLSLKASITCRATAPTQRSLFLPLQFQINSLWPPSPGETLVFPLGASLSWNEIF